MKEIRELDFYQKATEQGFSVFEGKLSGTAGLLLELHGAEDFLNFCKGNEIKSIILDTSESELAEKELPPIDEDGIINELRAYYEELLAEKDEEGNSVFLMDYISEDYYAPVLQAAISHVKAQTVRFPVEGPLIFPETIEAKQETSGFTSAMAYAYVTGLLITANVYREETAEESTKKNPADEILIREGKKEIKEKLNAKQTDAQLENLRILEIKDQAVLIQIRNAVEKVYEPSDGATQKARYEYADRIYEIWKTEKGIDWLTKTAVREIVEDVHQKKQV